MSLLDTVEPAGWKRTCISNSEVEYFTERDWKHESLFEWEPVYSSETVESLFSQCRKEALLGASEKFEFGVRAELHRMAESSMEGEK